MRFKHIKQKDFLYAGGGGEEEETATVKQGVKKEENERRNGEIILPSPLNLLTSRSLPMWPACNIRWR